MHDLTSPLEPEGLLHRREVCRVTPDGQAEKGHVLLLKEHSLELFLNGELWTKVVCTRTDLQAMVAGRLYTQKRISSFDDIAELCFSEDEKRAEIWVKKGSDPAGKQASAELPSPDPAGIQAFAERLRQGMPLHRDSFAVHSAFLARQGKILYACEDISRHNAVDKVIGLALQNHVPFTECMLFTTGRVPADMVEKTAAAGIPVLVTKAMPTQEAVKLAVSYGISLIGQLREDQSYGIYA